MLVDGSRVRKAKKVRIQKYPDTCGRDLTDLFLEQQLAYLPCNICPMLTHAAACAFLTSPQRHRSLVVCAELKGYTVVMIAAIVVIAGGKVEQRLPPSRPMNFSYSESINLLKYSTRCCPLKYQVTMGTIYLFDVF